MQTQIIIDFIGLFTFIAGLIIGLGAVTVIDIHGFIARRSSYWTRATISAHKVTKPMIWVGTFLVLVGGIIFYQDKMLFSINISSIHLVAVLLLVLNGLFLSFYVSPYLLKMENESRQEELLPQSFQNKIAVSLVISDVLWWGTVVLLVVSLVG